MGGWGYMFMGQLPSENGSSRSLMTDEIIKETFPSTIPESLNNQLGLEDDDLDSMETLGSSTEEEMIRLVEERHNRKRVLPKPKKRPRVIIQDDDESEVSIISSQTSTSENDEYSKQPNDNRSRKSWHIVKWGVSTEQMMEILHKIENICQRLVACKDTAPSTKGIHYHVIAIYAKPIRFSTVKEQFGDDAHIKYVVNPVNAMRYVMGEGANHTENKEVIFKKNPFTTRRIQTGIRANFYKELQETGLNMSNFQRLVQKPEYISCIDQYKHVRNLISLQEMNNHRRNKQRVIYWICGASGTGKSRLAHEVLHRWSHHFNSIAGVATTSTTAGQITGLIGGEKCVLIDDIKLDKIQLQDLLTITDQYPVTLDVKGGYIKYDPDLVLITCLNSAQDLANVNQKWSQKEIIQIIRRITYTLKTKTENNEITYECFRSLDNPLGSSNMEGAIDQIFQSVEDALPLN